MIQCKNVIMGGLHMLLQFSTGSVDDYQKSDVHVSVLNAGIQPANIAVSLVKDRPKESKVIVSHQFKVAPQTEKDIFSEAGLTDGLCRLVIDVDSPSLIFTMKVETAEPIPFCVNLIDTWSSKNSSTHRSTIPLLRGFASRGVPF